MRYATVVRALNARASGARCSDLDGQRPSTIANVSMDRARNFAPAPMGDFPKEKISDCGG
jgi:hypothetical protein